MAKKIICDDGVYRIRRGKLVKVPDEWVGRITTNETIRQRKSKLCKNIQKQISFKLEKYRKIERILDDDLNETMELL